MEERKIHNSIVAKIPLSKTQNIGINPSINQNIMAKIKNRQRPTPQQNRIEIESSKSAPKYKPKKAIKPLANGNKINPMRQSAKIGNNQSSFTETTGSIFTFNKAKKPSRKGDGKLDISMEMQKNSNFTKMNDLKRETHEAMKNKKEYERRIMTIQNRINAIKKQEKDWDKKVNKIKQLEIGRENYRQGKIDIAKKISKVEKVKKKEIAKKKIKAQNDRVELYRRMETSADKVIKRKYREFQDQRAEREKLEEIKKQIKFEGFEKNQQKRVKREKEIEKAKKEEELYELLKEEEKITQLAYVQNLAQKDADSMKSALEKLEKEEELCLKNLKTTQMLALKRIEESGLSPCRGTLNSNRGCKTPINFHRALTSDGFGDISADRAKDNKKRFRF